MPGHTLPPVNDALTRRLDGAAVGFVSEWLAGVAAMPGNPLGLRLATFGRALAAAATGAPELDFLNRVHGLHDAGRLPEIMGFYSGTGVRPWFEVIPTEEGAEVAGVVALAGAVPISYATFLYGLPDPTPGADQDGPQVRPVEDQEVETFSDVLLRGHGVPEAELPLARARQRHWRDQPGWTLYLATVDGEPAAAAVLRAREGVGYLANAATLPAFRGRGCQTALLRRRVADAAVAGCDLVAGQATFGSISQRNMQRLGLLPAFTVTTWRMRAPIGV